MVRDHRDSIQAVTMAQIMHKNALVCAVQQVHVCRQVKDYDFSDRCLSLLIFFQCFSQHYLFVCFVCLFVMKIVQCTCDKQKRNTETTRTTINIRHTQIVNNEIYISGAEDGNISQITL